MEKAGRAGRDTDEYIIWGTVLACWISKATDTHTRAPTEYVILTVFVEQQQLRYHASALRYT